MRRRRPDRRVTVDEGWLVCIGAAAAGADPHEVLAAADVGALARVVSDIEAGSVGPWQQAASALLAVAHHAPFRCANRAAAWLAAVDVLAQHGLRPSMTRAEDVLDVLETPGSVEEVAGRLERTSWATRPCPACGRRLRFGDASKRDLVMVGMDRVELTARCWVEHRAHDRFGRPFQKAAAPAHEPVRWRPVVHLADRETLIVITDDGALVLARDQDRAFKVSRLDDLPIGVTNGDELLRQGRALATVPASQVRFHATTGDVDLDLLVACPC